MKRILFLLTISVIISCKPLEYKVDFYTDGYRGYTSGYLSVVYIKEMNKYFIYESPKGYQFELCSLYSLDSTSESNMYKNSLKAEVDCELLYKKQTSEIFFKVDVCFNDEEVYRSSHPYPFDVIINENLKLSDFYYEPILDERQNDTIKKVEILLKNRGLPIVCRDSLTDFQTFNNVVYILNSNVQVIPPITFKKGLINKWNDRSFLLTFVDYKVLYDSIENNSVRRLRSIDNYKLEDYSYSGTKIVKGKQAKYYRKIARKINELITEK